MRTINRIIDTCMAVLSGIAALALGFLLIGICYSTFSRFLFNKPITSLVEYSTYSLIYITFLSAPQILKARGHIYIDMITNMMPKKGNSIMGIGVNLVGAMISGIIFYYGSLVVKDNYLFKVKVMDSMGTPQFILTMVIPIGMFFLTIQFVRNLLEDYKQLKEVR
jgi:TRAP-type C4-dicarboxylate transport system permease small subunit